MGFLRYLRLKIVVFFLRMWMGKRPRANPDSVFYIPSRDASRTIKAHIYRPINTQARLPTPVLFNFHGSGFVLPLHGSDDVYCRYVSSNTSFTVMDIQYRLSPEQPFPAALHDVEDVVRYVQSRPSEYDSSRLCISGFSAGANLSLAASSMILPRNTFRSAVAFYPPANLATQPETKSPPDVTGNRMPFWMSRVFDGSYFQGNNPRDPRISPYYSPAENFPNNILIVTPAQDYLADEGADLALRIKKECPDKHVISLRIEGCGHSWDKMAPTGSLREIERERAYAEAVAMLIK